MNNPVVKESLTTQPSDTPLTDALDAKLTEREIDRALDFARDLERELAAAQADAERYRWLRGDKRGRSLSVSSLEWTGNTELSDAAIDAAMKECGK